MRAGKPPEHGRRRAHFAVLDPRQGGAAHSAQRGKFIERPAPRSPQCAQTFGEAHIGIVANCGLVFHIRDNNLGNESVKVPCRRAGLEGRIACEAVLLQTPTSPQRNGSMPPPHHASIPAWAWGVPLLASALVALKMFHIVPSDDTYVLVLAGLFLAATVFAAVHHAEVLALKLGEPFGSILLAVAVTVIEAGLIVSIMLAGAEGSERVA